jgi:hypothetical protein
MLYAGPSGGWENECLEGHRNTGWGWTVAWSVRRASNEVQGGFAGVI